LSRIVHTVLRMGAEKPRLQAMTVRCEAWLTMRRDAVGRDDPQNRGSVRPCIIFVVVTLATVDPFGTLPFAVDAMAS